MSNDTIELQTPNGHKVVIRNYTTHGDDKQAAALLNPGMRTELIDGQQKITFDAEAMDASEAKYVELLVQSIDGSAENIQAQLEALRTEDYKVVDRAVKEITRVPKAASKS